MAWCEKGLAIYLQREHQESVSCIEDFFYTLRYLPHEPSWQPSILCGLVSVNEPQQQIRCLCADISCAEKKRIRALYQYQKADLQASHYLPFAQPSCNLVKQS